MSEGMANNKFTPWPMTEPAYTEQDLREAKSFVIGAGGFEICLCSDEHCGPKFEASLAAEFARIRSEARAGMREACGRLEGALQKGTIRYSHERGEPEISVAFAYEAAFTMPEWNEVQAALSAIRKLPDLAAADEAIERIKREARLEEATLWSRDKFTKTHSGYCDTLESHVKECLGCQRIAALSGKESSHGEPD